MEKNDEENRSGGDDRSDAHRDRDVHDLLGRSGEGRPHRQVAVRRSRPEPGTGHATVTFKQEGEKVTGHYSRRKLGEADLTGTVKGQDSTSRFDASLGGQSAKVSLRGEDLKARIR